MDVNTACSLLIGTDRLRLIGQQLEELFLRDPDVNLKYTSNSFVAVFLSSRRSFRFSEVLCSNEYLNCRCFRLDAVAERSSLRAGLVASPTIPLPSDSALDIPIPCFCALVSGRLLKTNPEFRSWLRSAGNHQGRGRLFKNLQEIVANSDRKRMDLLLQRAASAKMMMFGENIDNGTNTDFHDEFLTVFGTWISVRLRLVNQGVGTGAKREDSALVGVCMDVSRHRQIEASLYSRRERFALAIAASLDGIWEWRVGIPEVYFSGRLAALLGYERADFRVVVRSPKEFLSLIKKQDRLRFVRALRAHLRSRAVLDIEFRANHRNQGVRWYRLRGQALWSTETGCATRVAGSLTDVTGNREFRSHLQSQLDSLDGHAVLLTFDTNQILTHANERFLAISGFSIEDVRRKPFGELATSGVEKGTQQGLRSSRSHNPSRDYVFKAKNGSDCVVRGALSPILDIDGEPQGYSFFGFDVSQKYLAERERASEIGFRKAVFDSAGSIIITTDPQGMISTVNSTGLVRLEYSEEEVVGQKTPSIFFRWVSESSEVSDLVQVSDSHPAEGANRRGGFLLGLLGGLISGQILTCEGKARSRRGSEFPVLMSLSRVEDTNHEFIGYVIVAQDISELKRIERSKSAFVAAVSHELRTPLTSISGALQVINAMPGNVPQTQLSELIKMALRSSDRLLLLINDLLDMQKIESGRMDFDFKEISAQELVQFSISTMEALAREHNVSMRFSGPEKPLVLVGDFNRLVQVMVNLLSNAIKFAPEGSTISVSLRQARGAVRLGVRDSGPGVPAEFQSRIFEKFSQADGANAKSKGGTGLGLSICKVILAQHGSNIQFWSDPREGTEFYFEIPETAERARGQQAEGLPNDTDVSVHGGRAKILVVEDDPDIADLLCGMLEECGFQTIQARTVAAARTALAQEFVDLVTLDLIMPDANGSVLLDEMACSAKLENIPVLVISGYADRVGGGRFATNAWPAKASKGKTISEGHSGTNHFATLSKPIKLVDLKRLVTQALAYRAKRVILFIANSNGSRAVSFLRGVCEHSASVIEVPSVQDAVDFLAHHVAACVVLVDMPSKDSADLLAVLRRQTEPATLIRWHLEDDPKDDYSGKMGELEASERTEQIPSEVGSFLTVIEIFGMHWGAAAQFQQVLSDSGVLEAS